MIERIDVIVGMRRGDRRPGGVVEAGCGRRASRVGFEKLPVGIEIQRDSLARASGADEQRGGNQGQAPEDSGKQLWPGGMQADHAGIYSHNIGAANSNPRTIEALRSSARLATRFKPVPLFFMISLPHSTRGGDPRLLASLAIAASAQSPVSLSLDPAKAGSAIPDDFAGLSFEMQLVLPDSAGRHFFRPDNTRLIATFRSLGIRSLRVGGNTTDNPAVRVPEPADLDSLFAFARAAGVKVIFTLRLRQGDPTAAASVAKYLMDHYADDVVCFAIGNEPNIYDKTYPAYVADLKKYIAAVTAPGVAPAAVFCGPSTTPNHAEWARDLANDFGAAGSLRLITQHEYPGNSGSKVTDQAAARRSDAFDSLDLRV